MSINIFPPILFCSCDFGCIVHFDFASDYRASLQIIASKKCATSFRNPVYSMLQYETSLCDYVT